MKKVICGSFMFMSGMISSALLFGFSMVQDWIIDGVHSSIWNISQYGLLPVLVLFIVISASGLGLSLWGMIEKNA